jgi:tRNA 2-thiouridine synthesizing protein A
MAIIADKVQDSVGQMCPMPIVYLAKNMRQMQVGQVLEIHADDDGAHADIPAWCKQTGNEFLGSEPDNGFVRYYIKKVV